MELFYFCNRGGWLIFLFRECWTDLARPIYSKWKKFEKCLCLTDWKLMEPLLKSVLCALLRAYFSIKYLTRKMISSDRRIYIILFHTVQNSFSSFAQTLKIEQLFLTPFLRKHLIGVVLAQSMWWRVMSRFRKWKIHLTVAKRCGNRFQWEISPKWS